MGRSKRARRKPEESKHQRGRPPLSEQAEAAYYAIEEEQGKYDWFWRDMGYFLDHGTGFPPFLEERKAPSRQNNRAPGWNGIFTFVFLFTDTDPDIQKNILQALTKDYQCALSDGERLGEYQASLQTTGKRVKSLTRMLNRQYTKGYLVWKEL